VVASVVVIPTPAAASGGTWPRPDEYAERFELSVRRWPAGGVCLGDTIKFTVVVRRIGIYHVRSGPSKYAGSATYEVDLGPTPVPVSVDFFAAQLEPLGQAANGTFSFRAVQATGWAPLRFIATDPHGDALKTETGATVWNCDYRVLTMSTWYVTAEANVMAVSMMNTVLKARLVDPSHLELSNPAANVYNFAAYAHGRACPAQEVMSSAPTNVDGQVDLDAGTMWVYVPYPSVPVSTLVTCPGIAGSNSRPDSGDPYPFKVTLNNVEGGVIDLSEPQLRVPGLGVSDGDTHAMITRLHP
jgi:hypothetical protein